MTQPHVLELAKQGDPDAIATLMNQSLQPRGMTALVERQGDVLEVTLEAERVPNRDALTAFVQKGIDNLGIESVRSIRIVGQQTGATFPAWMQELNLAAFPLESAEPPTGDPEPQVQPVEMLDLSPTDDELPLEESLLEISPDAPLDLDDRSLEESIDSFATDPQQLALEAQLQSLWAQPDNEDLLTPTESISEAEFQDLFAEDSPELDPEPPAASAEDLLAEDSATANQTGSIEDLFAEEPTSSAASIEELFPEESTEENLAAPSLEDLFAEENPATAAESIEDLFAEEPQPIGVAPSEETPLEADLFATATEELLVPPADLFGNLEVETADPAMPDTFQTFFVEDEQESVSPPVDLTLPDADAAESPETLDDLFGEAPDTESLDTESSEAPDLSELFAAETYPAADASDLPSGSPPEESSTLEDSLFTLDFNEPASPAMADPASPSEAIGDQTAPPASEELDDALIVASLQDLFGSDAPDEPISFELPAPDTASDLENEVELTPSPNEPAEAIAPAEAGDDSEDDLPTALFADPAIADPVAADASEQPIPEDWLSELQGLDEMPIEYVFGAAEPEAPPSQLEGSAAPEADPLPEDFFAAAPEGQSFELDATDLAQQELEAQIDSLWAEQGEEPTFELEEEPIDSPIASSDLTFDWETPLGEAPLIAESQPSSLDLPLGSLETDPLFGLEAVPAEASEVAETSEVPEEVPELEPIIFPSLVAESADALADLSGASATDAEPILRLEETLEAPPDGELPLEGELPAIEEIPSEAVDFDEASLAEAAEQPTLLLPRGWEDRLLAEDALLPAEEIPAEAADLDETFLAEVADEPTLPPVDELDRLLAEDPLLPAEEIPAEAADLDETFLAEVADEPTLPPPENWEDELLFDLSDESAPPAPEPTPAEPIDQPDTPLESLSADFLAEEPLPPSDYGSSVDAANTPEATLADLFAEPQETSPEPIDSATADDLTSSGAFGAELSEADLAAGLPDLLDETPDEPIANLMYDPLQDELGIDVLEEPATAPTQPPTAADAFEAELAGLTLDDLPESEAAAPKAQSFDWVNLSSSDAADGTAADPADLTTDNSSAPDLELPSDFFDTPSVSPVQSVPVEIDEFYDLPPDLLDQPPTPQSNQAAIPELFPAPSIPLSDDRLPEEPTEEPTEEPAADPLELDVDAAFADETPSQADVDFLPELPTSEERFDSQGLPAEPPEIDEVGNLSLGLDPDAFTEEDVRLAHTNSWETDNTLPVHAEDTETNGMSEAAVVAAGLVGGGGLASDRPTFEGGTIGNGRDYATAGAIEASNAPWLYTAVLLGVSGLIAGLLGYSLWSEVARRPAAPVPSPPASISPSGALPQEVLQTDEVV